MPRFCPSCDASVPRSAAFCDACGAPLEEDTPARRGETRASSAARRESRRELAAARKRVDTLRLTYTALGVVYLLFLLLFASWWWRLADRGWGGTGFVLLAQLLTLFSAVDAAVMLVCRRYVERSPVVLGSVGASLVSVSTALFLLQLGLTGANPPMLGAVVLRVVLAVALWALLPAAVSLRRLQDTHPELLRRRRGAATEERAERRREARRVGLPLGAAGVFLLGLGWWLTRPAGPETLAARFEGAWNSGDATAVAALFERSERLERWLRRRVGEELPRIRGREVEVEVRRAHLRFDTGPDADDLVVTLLRRDRGWSFEGLGLR